MQIAYRPTCCCQLGLLLSHASIVTLFLGSGINLWYIKAMVVRPIYIFCLSSIRYYSLSLGGSAKQTIGGAAQLIVVWLLFLQDQ